MGAFRTLVAFTFVVASTILCLPAAQASLNGIYLVRNAGKNLCLRASSPSPLYVVDFAVCNPNDPLQKWQVVEIAKNDAGYGINVISIRDSADNQLCLTGANYYTSRPHLKACVSGNLGQQWTTSGPIYGGIGYGDSYRMRWNKNFDLCIDNGGSAVNEPNLDTCVGQQHSNRINQQWYFNLQ